MSGAAAKTNTIVTRLIIGLASAEIGEVRSILPYAIDYITRSEEALTELKTVLLFTALRLNDHVLAERCIKEWKISPNVTNALKQTPLSVLMSEKHASRDWLDFLISEGADPMRVDAREHSVLHTAAEHGRLDCLRYLIEKYPQLLPDSTRYDQLLSRPFAHICLLPQHVDTFCYLLSLAKKEDLSTLYGMDILYDILSANNLCDEGEEAFNSKLRLARVLCQTYGVNPRGTTRTGKTLAEHIVHARPSRPLVNSIITILCTEWDHDHSPPRLSDPSSVESVAAETVTTIQNIGRKGSEDSIAAGQTRLDGDL